MAVAQDSMDGQLALKHCKACLTIVAGRIARWDGPADTKELATIYNDIALSEMLINNVEETIKTWQLSYKAFRKAEDTGPLGPTWLAISLGIVYSQRDEPDKGEDFLKPLSKAREELLGKDNKTSSESGSSWRTVGHIRVAQRRFGEGLELHQRALENLPITLGDNYSQTADCTYNVVQDLLRLGRNDEASELLDKVITAYGDRYEAGAARTLWRKGKLLQQTRKRLEAKGVLNKAMRIRKTIAPDDHRPEEELVEKDWDDLLYYYSR